MHQKSMGKLARYYREHKSLSLREVAERADISPTYLSLIERDKTSPPSEEVILSLEKVLGLREGELMALSGKVPEDIIDVMGRHPVLIELVRVVSERYMDDEIEGITHGLR